jgi:hypothetical protein
MKKEAFDQHDGNKKRRNQSEPSQPSIRAPCPTDLKEFETLPDEGQAEPHVENDE